MDEKLLYLTKDEFSRFRGMDFRENQINAIQAGLDPLKKVSVLCLPTGAGKSLIGTISASIVGNGCYLVHSKPLQMQLQNDFPELPIMWGRNNYDCILRMDGTKCDSCIKCEHHNGRCYYMAAKRRALDAPVSILNYEYWITETNYVGGFSGVRLIVVDEADSLEMSISKFISLTFSDGMMKNLKLPMPNYKTVASEKALDDWRSWAEMAKRKVTAKIKETQGAIDSDRDNPELIKRMQNLSGIVNKLCMFINSVDYTWLMEVNEYNGNSSITFKPTWIDSDLAYKNIWGHADRFVLMSATFPPVVVLAKILGLSVKDISYNEFPSTFPVENRPVILDPVVNMTYKDMDSQFGILKEKVKELLRKHRNEKGIIHCVSYKICKEIMSIGDDRLVTHDGRNKIEALEYFKRSDAPLVFVSPSSERGISLEDDKCRFVIWAKAPFLSLADKLVSARVYGSSVGNLWYKSDMLQTVVQGCGRAVRSKDDFAVSYILDQQIVKCLADNPRMVPGWWRDAVAFGV